MTKKVTQFSERFVLCVADRLNRQSNARSISSVELNMFYLSYTLVCNYNLHFVTKCFIEQCFENNIGYWGNDILDSKDHLHFDSKEHCQAACFAESKCIVWSYNKQIKRCFLKTTVGNDIRKNKDFISGPNTCNG